MNTHLNAVTGSGARSSSRMGSRSSQYGLERVIAVRQEEHNPERGTRVQQFFPYVRGERVTWKPFHTRR